MIVHLGNNVTAYTKLKALGCYAFIGKCRFIDRDGAYYVAIPLYSEGVKGGRAVVGELIYEAYDIPAPYLTSVELVEYANRAYKERDDYVIELRNSSTLDYIYESDDFYY